MHKLPFLFQSVLSGILELRQKLYHCSHKYIDLTHCCCFFHIGDPCLLSNPEKVIFLKMLEDSG